MPLVNIGIIVILFLLTTEFFLKLFFHFFINFKPGIIVRGWYLSGDKIKANKLVQKIDLF